MTDSCSRLVAVTNPNHHQTLVGGLWKYVTTRHRVDLSFRLEGSAPVPAHRLVLEQFLSPEKLLATSVDSAVQSADEMETPLHDVGRLCRAEDKLSSELLLEFLYTGTVLVSEEQLDVLLEIAGKLDLQMLADAVRSTKEIGYVPTLATPAIQTTASNVQSDQLSVRRNSRSHKLNKNHAGGNKITETSSKSSLRRTPKRSRRTAALISADVEDSDSAQEDDDSVADGDFGSRLKGRLRLAEPVFRCEHCDYKTKRKNAFDVHQAEHDPSIETFTCSVCCLRFACRKSLSRHELAHSGAAYLYDCEHCGNKFRKKSAYDVHQAKHDPTVKVFRCDLCCQKFLSQQSLERHKLRHKGYKCPHCDFVAQKRWKYENHLFRVHEVNCSGKPLAKLKCPECPFTCVYEARMKYHAVAKHSGQKPFRCDLCSFASGTKSDVNKHVKAFHLRIKPFLCDACGFRTVSTSQLEKHKRTHTGEKPFTCEKCSKSYASYYTLKEHLRLHSSSEKPYVCEICGRAYNRKEHLTRHLKSVHQKGIHQKKLLTPAPPINTEPLSAGSSSTLPNQFLPWPPPTHKSLPPPSIRAPDSGSVGVHCNYGAVGTHQVYM